MRKVPKDTKAYCRGYGGAPFVWSKRYIFAISSARSAWGGRWSRTHGVGRIITVGMPQLQYRPLSRYALIPGNTPQ
ncbi:hypothetical protein [Neobacillus bataviensis]|uniref:hypothetical protein n=1 Tax=Neobacillus bataviensis TaxID=220685 RepID=UPI001CBBE74C|nr:hypothetical protein [Neobacillus bataviensis]